MFQRKSKQLIRGAHATKPALEGANQQWSLDFVSDATAQGRVLRLLTVIYAHTRECLVIDTDASLTIRR